VLQGSFSAIGTFCSLVDTRRFLYASATHDVTAYSAAVALIRDVINLGEKEKKRLKTRFYEQEQQHVAVRPGNAQFMFNRQVSLRHGTCGRLLHAARRQCSD